MIKGVFMERRQLLDLLQRCGHHLHNQKGKKFGQYRILLILSRHPKITQKELQELLHIQAGSLSEILTKMEGYHLIERTKREEDRRSVQIQITKAGLAKVQCLTEEYQEENELLFSSLSDEECSILWDLLSRLYLDWRGEEYA